MSMNAQTPRNHIAVCDHHARGCDRQRSKTQLIQMQKIRARVAHDRAQIILCCMEVLFTVLHPVETKRGGMILEAVQPIHPGSLMGKRNFYKAKERYLCPVRHQTRNQFARVSPYSAERVGRYQYAHRTPGESRAGILTLGLLGSSLESATIPRKEFFLRPAMTYHPDGGNTGGV